MPSEFNYISIVNDTQQEKKKRQIKLQRLQKVRI